MGDRDRGANYPEQAGVGGEERRRQAQRSRENEASGGDRTVADEIGGGGIFWDRSKRGIALNECDSDCGSGAGTIAVRHAELDA
jgi:hypothetical protein